MGVDRHGLMRPAALLTTAALALACSGPVATPSVSPASSASPAATAVSSPSPAATPADQSTLDEALAYLGPIPQTIAFTDWTAIRAGAGAEALTGASSIEEKFLAIRNAATAGGFGMSTFRTHVADWGFDVFDLAWEARADGPEAHFWILRMRDGFDTSVIAAKLDEYGFRSEQLARGILRTATGPSAGGPGPGNVFLVEFTNTGFLDDGRTLVVSAGSADAVREILTSGPLPVADLSVRSAAGLLGGPTAAALRAADECSRILAQTPGAQRAGLEAELEAAGPLGHYNALAVGYRLGRDPIGRIVFGYAEAGQAAADLAGREQLAREGHSLRNDIRYADRYFSVAGAHVEDRAVVLDVGPVSPRQASPLPTPAQMSAAELFARNLIVMWIQRDMLFGACSP